ncbi:MAG: hypothetical protein HON76_16750 [Candidatus Scalindua sp.]|jgi:hypothetical protein|nr:hypothetical protein [Candidatus Scalindua sp.]MBT5306166.1 hypothetical protein [Candidatus Scalindua sp.]MBT6230012.1 hypothetical protein [Candidatus Scalindua sp.]MBT6564166.1 hypothetical protein [Candidatus Scalindua sp.]MBT7210064.1 hypothetical protein [Candidatus Scalindua sp.]
MLSINGKKRNIIEIQKHHDDFKLPGIRFSVSGRNIRADMDVYCYLKTFYIYTDINNIESVFGNAVFPSLLYGGRVYQVKSSLTSLHLAQLKEMSIGFSITLTNHFFDEEAYKQSYSFLETHHRKGNSVICGSDRMAKRVRKDFPDYKLRASIIKNINTVEKVRKALDLYDQVVIPMDKNDDDGFLEKLPQKWRIMLFGNAGCAYTCKARTCYYGFSQTNRHEQSTSDCSKEQLPRLDLGKTYFDIKKFHEMGFSHFKLIPSVRDDEAGSFAVDYTKERRPPLKTLIRKPVYYICSYPKSGRTWLRFVLSNYINLKFNLNIKVDFHSVFTLIPNFGYDRHSGVEVYDYFSDNRFPLILASHAKYDPEKYSDGKIIFLLRSVYDIMVSDYFQNTDMLKRWNGNIKSFIRSRESGIYRLCSYFNSWVQFLQEKKALIVSYEELYTDAESTVSNVLGFLEIPVDKQLLQQFLKSSSFPEMKKREKEKGVPGIDYAACATDTLMVREGIVGDYRKYLDSEDISFIDNVYEKELTPESKNLLSSMSLIS